MTISNPRENYMVEQMNQLIYNMLVTQYIRKISDYIDQWG